MKRIFLKISNNYWNLILLITLASIAFFPCLGSVHLFDWDEINFAEAAREMMVTGNYSEVQINFKPFYEKPPLFFWLQVLSMKVWGINEFAARFPNAMFGIITVLTLYLIGKTYKNSRFGLLWSFVHLSALLPHFYFKTGIIDPVFNYFVFLSVYCLICLIKHTSVYSICWAPIGGMCVGLAMLTKGPIGILLPVLTLFIYWIKVGCKPIISWHLCILFGLASLLIPFFWFGYQTYQDGGMFVKSFIKYQIELFNQPIAGHGQPFYYHFIVVFFGCFPASVLALGSFNLPKSIENGKLFPIMHILFWVVMVAFSLATTKIAHYSSMAYFPISFLGAHYLYGIDQKLTVPSRVICTMLISVGILIAALFIMLPVVALYKEKLYGVIADKFTLASIELAVPWGWRDCIVGISYLLLLVVAYYFFKKQSILYFSMCCAIATTACLGLGTVFIVPKIGAHTQRPAIEFYKNLAGQPVYVTTVGFKSYAPFFYFEQPQQGTVTNENIHWLLTSQLDKPAYFVIKITDKDQLEGYKDITFITAQGGFAFYKRDIG